MIKARDRYAADFNYHCVPRNEGSYLRVNILDVEERRKVAYRGFESENQFYRGDFSALRDIPLFLYYSIILGTEIVSHKKNVRAIINITNKNNTSSGCFGKEILRPKFYVVQANLRFGILRKGHLFTMPYFFS